MIPATMFSGRAKAKAPGACGELAQGMTGDSHFLVTCPIDIYSTATVELTEGVGRVSGPGDAPKARRAIELTLARFRQVDVDACLRLSSPLPRRKGMASSSADVSAAIVATAAALGRELAPEETAEIALGVEPSDGVMFPHIAMFDHRQGKAAEVLGEPPPMRVMILDFGGGVDTVAFNNTDRKAQLKRLESQVQESLSCITTGIRQGDVDAIGRGASLSALANQEILYKPQLDAVVGLSTAVGAAGVNVAHSGTVIGMLFPDDAPAVENAVIRAREKFPELKRIFHQRVVSGGVILATPRAGAA